MSQATARPLARLGPPVALMATAMLVWIQWNGVTKGIWVDSDVYVMGAKTLLDGGDLYAPVSSVDLRFTYSPFAAATFVPLAILPVDLARLVLTLASVASLGIVLEVLRRRLGLSWWVTGWLALAAFALEPMLRNLLLGQVNLLLMVLVVLDLLVVPARGRGFLVGVAAGIKITPAVFAVHFLLRRDWRAFAQSIAGFALTVALGWVVAPASSASFWGGGFLGLGRFGADSVVGTDNQSLLAAALRLLGVRELPLVAQAALALVGVGLGAAAAWRSLQRGGRTAEVAAVAWIALGGLIASPVSWTHHWVLVLLALATFAARGQGVRAGLVLVALWFPTVWLLYTETPFGELSFPWWKAALSAVYTVVALVVLTVEALRPPSRGPTEPARERVPADRARSAPSAP